MIQAVHRTFPQTTLLLQIPLFALLKLVLFPCTPRASLESPANLSVRSFTDVDKKKKEFYGLEVRHFRCACVYETTCQNSMTRKEQKVSAKSLA